MCTGTGTEQLPNPIKREMKWREDNESGTPSLLPSVSFFGVGGGAWGGGGRLRLARSLCFGEIAPQQVCTHHPLCPTSPIVAHPSSSSSSSSSTRSCPSRSPHDTNERQPLTCKDLVASPSTNQTANLSHFLQRSELIDSTLVTLSNATERHSGRELLKSKYCRLLLTSNSSQMAETT